ncbi:MAG: PEP-CTERM sorting domain-containing protein [Akkermansia sp.]|nr:PEP-CTERM sorting domain-containing protein [Akkermansia sp.]
MKRILTTLVTGFALVSGASAESLEKGYITATGGLALFADSPDLEMSNFSLQINNSDGTTQSTDEYDVADLTFTTAEQQNRNHLLPNINMHVHSADGDIPTSWTIAYTFTNNSTDKAYKVQDLRLNLYAMHKEADSKLHPIAGAIEANIQPGYIYHNGIGSLTETTCTITGTGDGGVVGGSATLKLPTGFTLQPLETITLFLNVTGTNFYHNAECELYIGIEGFELTGEVLPAPAVPEPTTATLSLLALAGLMARRRRK